MSDSVAAKKNKHILGCTVQILLKHDTYLRKVEFKNNDNFSVVAFCFGAVACFVKTHEVADKKKKLG
jgi:hypothetical protein